MVLQSLSFHELNFSEKALKANISPELNEFRQYALPLIVPKYY